MLSLQHRAQFKISSSSSQLNVSGIFRSINFHNASVFTVCNLLLVCSVNPQFLFHFPCNNNGLNNGFTRVHYKLYFPCYFLLRSESVTEKVVQSVFYFAFMVQFLLLFTPRHLMFSLLYTLQFSSTDFNNIFITHHHYFNYMNTFIFTFCNLAW